MKLHLASIILIACQLMAPFNAQATNVEPIIFVHGFSGWGPGEMLGYRYWGGLNDIVGYVGANKPSWCSSGNCQVYTAVVGPVSSNWDRAVELFYQIKGGCVDYGHHHSNNILPLNATTGLPDTNVTPQTHFQLLNGQNGAPTKCYTGLYTQWDANHKIHLIGHSQGGQTIRMLDYLLRFGSPQDVAEEPSLTNETVQANPFTGGKNWIHSITTVSTPHNGTTLSSVVSLSQVAQQLVAAVAVEANISAANMVYDFKLDQWGLVRQVGESWNSYSNRVYSSSIWQNTTDISAWDLHPDGARLLNNADSIDANIYYFSFATQQTYRDPFSGCWYADSWLTSIFQPQAGSMGCYTRNQPGHVVIDGSWFQNDGVVNTNSMMAPTTGTTPQSVINYNGTPQKGIWQYMGLLDWDHMDIVGTLCENNDWAHCDPRQTYLTQSTTLWGLN